MMATIDITKLSKDVLDYPDAEARLSTDGGYMEPVTKIHGGYTWRIYGSPNHGFQDQTGLMLADFGGPQILGNLETSPGVPAAHGSDQ